MGAPLGGDGAPQPSVPFAWGAARIPCTHTQRRCPGGLVGRGRVLLGARLCRRPYVWVGPPGGGGWRPLRSDAAAGGDRCAATRRNGTAPPCRSVVAAAIPRSSDGALPLPLPPPAPTTRAHGITARTASPPRRSRRWPRRRPSGGGRVASSTCCSRCAPSGGHALSADGTAGMLRRGVGSAAMAPPRPHWRRPSGGGGGAVRCGGAAAACPCWCAADTAAPPLSALPADGWLAVFLVYAWIPRPFAPHDTSDANAAHVQRHRGVPKRTPANGGDGVGSPFPVWAGRSSPHPLRLGRRGELALSRHTDAIATAGCPRCRRPNREWISMTMSMAHA